MKRRRSYAFQKRKGFKYTISAIVLIVLFVTVGYAVFNTSLYASLLAYFRSIGDSSAAVNMRITSVSAQGTTPAIVNNVEYSSDTITSSIVLPSSSITYTVTVMNNGTAAGMISDISLSDTYASNINVELTDYAIGDSIDADDSVTFTITLSLKGSTAYGTLQNNVPIYFTFSSMEDSNADINLKVYLQNRDSSTGAATDGYTRVYFIPKSDYTYNSTTSSCTNGSTITYDSTTHKFTITSSGKDSCEAYFDAVQTDSVKGSPNSVIELYVEMTAGEGDYVQVGEIPTSHTYTINTDETTAACSSATIDNTNHVINLTASSDLQCSIYLDIAS